MATDPGDLVLDPTCGSGTTAYVAEQWGRRWITIDTSRVALALARARIMGARYPYYLLADSRRPAQGGRDHPQRPSSQPTRGDIRQGFVYERVPHITLKSIANNAEIDVIWEQWQATLEPLREASTSTAKVVGGMGNPARGRMPGLAGRRRRKYTPQWWRSASPGRRRSTPPSPPRRISNTSTTSPTSTRRRVRVAGPFTVESLSPHRVLGVDENDELIDAVAKSPDGYGEKQSFAR